MKPKSTSLLSPSFWVCTGALLTFSLGLAGGARAEGAAKPRPGVISKKLQTGIEEKLGKAVTPDQLDQMKTAAAARLEAVKAAEEKFIADLAKITGLTPEDVKAAMSPPRAKKEGAAEDKNTEKAAEAPKEG